MIWTKATIDTTCEAVDIISYTLNEMGIEGIEIEDNKGISEEDKKAMFIDILPECDENDESAKVSFYIDIRTDNKPDDDNYGNRVNGKEEFGALIEKVKEELENMRTYCNVGPATITVSKTDDADWLNKWKEFFKPFRVADDIIIKPTWEKLDNKKEDDIVVEIDPGTAFGTGSHETTRLCISSLRKHINEDTVLLDVGCGSGILSIIGILLGAKKAFGTDIDRHALEATFENAKVNNIDKDKFDAIAGNIIDDEEIAAIAGFEKYDIAVANILADVIIPLSATISRHIKPGGLFISSGIINTKAKEVKEAILSNGFEIIEENTMGDWVSYVALKPL